MNKKIFIFLCIFSIFSCIAYARDYSLLGFDVQDFSLASGGVLTAFNQNFQGTPYIYSRILQNNVSVSPLYYDIDGDGLNEVFGFSGQSVYIYHGKELTLVNSFVANTTLTGEIEDAGIFSYSGNTYLVLLVAYASGDTYALNYIHDTGYNFNNVYMKRAAGNTAVWTKTYGKASAVNCYSLDCLLVQFSNSFGTPITQSFKLTDVNLSGAYISPISLQFDTADNQFSYKPSTPFNVVHQDIDNDGIEDFLISYTYNSNLKITAIYINNSYNPKLKASTQLFSSVSQATNIVTGTFNPFFKSFAGAYLDTSNKHHTYSGYFSSPSFSAYASHSSIFSSASSAISDTFGCKIFTNDDNNNYCVIGYTSQNATYVMGSTDFGVPFLSADTIIAPTSNNSNYYVPSMSTLTGIAHGINANPNSLYTDFITPFGIYSLTDVNGVLGTGSLTRIFAMPNNLQNVVIIPSKLTTSPLYTLLMQSSTNLISITTNETINAPEISAYSVNPCLNQGAWNLSTAVSVTIQPKSYLNAYDVSARAILYYNDINIQDSNWTQFLASNTIFSFNFIANETINNGVLRLMAKDTNQIETYHDFTFSVGLNGIPYNSCQSSGTLIEPEETVNNQTFNNQPLTNTNNALRYNFDRQAETLGVPPLIFFIMIIGGINFVILLASLSRPELSHHLGTVLVGIVIMDIFVIVLATFLGVISSALLIILIVILIIIGVLYLTYVWNKTSSG